MAVYADWRPDVAIDVPNCPAPTIDRQIKRAVLDFVERTRILVRTAGPANVASGAAPIAFASPFVAAGERVLEVKQAWWFDKELPIRSPEAVVADYGLVDWPTAVGEPLALLLDRDLSEYRVVPAPGATQTNVLRMRLAYGYTEAATTVDDELARKWRDAIAAGARQRLLVMPDQKWSNPQLAAYYASIYEDGVASASVAAARGAARGPLQTKPRFF